MNWLIVPTYLLLPYTNCLAYGLFLQKPRGRRGGAMTWTPLWAAKRPPPSTSSSAPQSGHARRCRSPRGTASTAPHPRTGHATARPQAPHREAARAEAA
uniref:Uncharacterized protein n=1 Tax=Arundo donax TaxID=35708 RepID=A0A0A8YWU8_ARUDO